MGSRLSLQRQESLSTRAGQAFHGGASSTSQLPAFNVPASAANAAASKPLRASKTACKYSRPSSVLIAPGAPLSAISGAVPTHSQSPGRAFASCCACCEHQNSSPLSTSRRRMPAAAICAVSVAKLSFTSACLRYSALPKVLHWAGSPLSKPRLNQL